MCRTFQPKSNCAPGSEESPLCNSYNFLRRAVSNHYADIDSFLQSATAALAPRSEGGLAMLDITMLAIGLGLFVATVGYCYLCNRL